MYFHVMPLHRVCFDRLLPNPQLSNPDFKPMYYWLEQEIGYYPFFLAVAEDISTIYYMTGFHANFKTRTSFYNAKADKFRNCRIRSKRPHQVLFKFPREAFTYLHYQDYDAWNMILNVHFLLETADPARIPDLRRRLHLWRRILLKEKWSEALWHHKSRTDVNTVQATTPEIDLRKAKAVYCKTRKAQKHLQRLGFQNVILYRVKRYKSPKPFQS